MNRRHLRTENCIILTHFFCKCNLFDRSRTNGTFFLFLFTHTDCGEKRAYTDSCSSKIIYFINLQSCVDLIWICKDLSNLICCNSIQSTSEGVELNQIKILRCLYIICGSIQSGVVHPLIHNIQRVLCRIQMRDRVFCKDCNIVGCNEFRQTMIYLRIDMVWTTGKYDTAVSCFI